MALFKVSKGISSNLPSVLTEGHCWYTYDDSKFYIDYKDEDGILRRKSINSQNAETLMGMSYDEIMAYVRSQDAATLDEAKSYTDNEIAFLLNNSSEAVDSIMELATAMSENENVVAALTQAIGGKADTDHDHDDQYYTEEEIDNKLNEKANLQHDHDNVITVEGGGSLVLSEIFGEAPYVIEITSEEIEDVGGLQGQLDEIRDLLDQKTQVQIITWEAWD